MGQFSLSDMPAALPDSYATVETGKKTWRRKAMSAVLIAGVAVVASTVMMKWETAPKAESISPVADKPAISAATKLPRPAPELVAAAEIVTKPDPVSPAEAVHVKTVASSVPVAEPDPVRFGGVLAEPGTTPTQEVGKVEPTAAAAELDATTAPVEEVVEVNIAETEAEIQAAEEALAITGNAYFKLPVAESEAPFDAVLKPASVSLPSARTNAWVNMRAGPDNDAKTLAIVPANTAIGAEQGCRHWCKVVYEGQQGFIYKSFIKRTR